MAVSYHQVLRGVAIRAGLLWGGNMVSLETSYTTTPLTLAEFEGNETSFQEAKDAVLLAEEKLAWAIADTANHPWRTYLSAVTADQASPSILVSTSSGTKPIIGVWGSIVDSTSAIVCSEMPLDQVRRRSINANTQFKCPVYWYNITGNRIEHTRTNVKLEVCIYSRTDQSTALEANGSILLPDALEYAYVCGAVAALGKDDGGYFNQALVSISKGQLPALAITQPAQGVGN